jgi:transcription elongation factor Elf1
MGRRRKRRKTTRPKKVRLPARYFQCPVCGSMTLTIDFKKTNNPMTKLAIAKCGTCGLYCEIPVNATLDRIDVYNIISDLAYENRLDECRKKEEKPETVEEPATEESEEEE